MSDIFAILKAILTLVPFLLCALLLKKNNLKKPDRSRQCYMPIVAVIFCIVAGFLLSFLTGLVIDFFNHIHIWIADFGGWIAGLFDGALDWLGNFFIKVAGWLGGLLEKINIAFWAQILVNTLIAIGYLIIKRIVITILKGICKDDAKHYEVVSKIAYIKNPEDGKRYVKPHMAQGVTMMKALYYCTLIFGVIGVSASTFMYNHGLIASLYYPVFSVILVGEIYFFLDGERWDPEHTTLTGEGERATKIVDYSFMRQVLSRNFGDKLMSDNTSVNSDLMNFKTNDELVEQMLQSQITAEEAYGLFMQKKIAAGLEADQNYMASGLDLLNGKSVVFNNPFYYDLIPYIFFPMNRTILRRKKVLIVLGRHAIEQDVEKWCRQGLASVTGIPSLWNIGVLNSSEQSLDVGIVTRSSVHDLQMHENNTAFFRDVEFVVLIEPSRLVATAQIGLNSLVRHCRRDGKKLVFCSFDKNCDGLVDALSHILMTSLEEVSATNKHQGVSSYMCWEADEEHLQHRMLPNLSRYLGVGTELSFTALKNQISKTAWYGGEAFPVMDVHWIAKQYYYDLLRFASLPTVQSTFDEVFTASANMWNAKVQDESYLTVEDESFNMYEVKRAFATRSKNHGFVNVVSTDYLLKDYMAANDGIFDADSKAIPYIVADYAHTERNVIYRLCLRLNAYPQTEEEIRRELSLLNVDLGKNVVETLWSYVCKIAQGVNVRYYDEKTRQEQLKLTKDGKEYVFTSDVITCERKYSYRYGRLETLYSIKNKKFVNVFLDDLCSAEYVAEDETDQNQFLGTELRGHIFQKYLPGQFFTFGGKYYEMLRLTLDGRVIVRRAADHINGRPQYRQVRNYTIHNVEDSTMMGDCKDIGGVRVTKQHADIQVETPAYWRMQRYNDFKTGKKISINGVPVRHYYNKQLLKIDFPRDMVSSEKTLSTVALLMNEVFRTLYAENQGMIVAVTAGDAQAPMSYSLDGVGVSENSLYIIEDSQMDIGFLVSVERNLTRIFSIICDYLQWHTKTLADSLTPPPEPEIPDFTLTEEQKAEEAEAEKAAKKKKGIRGFFGKIGGFFGKIGGFFKKLFKRKPKDPNAPEKPKKPKKEKIPKVKKEKPPKPEKVKKEKKPKKEKKKKKGKGEEEAVVDAEAPVEGQEITGQTPEDSGVDPEDVTLDEDIPAEEEIPIVDEIPVEEEIPTEDIFAEPEEQWEPEATPVDDMDLPIEEEEPEHPVLMNVAPPKWLFNMAPVLEEAPEEAPIEELPVEEMPVEEFPVDEFPVADYPTDEFPVEEIPTEDLPIEDIPVEDLFGEDAPVEELPVDADPAPEAELAVEPEKAQAAPKTVRPKELTRKPYHERYYLLFGGDEEPETVDFAGTLDLLTQLGFGNGALEQARKGLSEIENIEKNFIPNRSGARYCDFCGKELFGSEYEILADGRERCMVCGRTAVKTEKDFKKIYSDVMRNLTIFFGININAPIKLQMVNAKKLHKKLGKSFVPSGEQDGRVLGVAIKDKKEGYSILLENGSPRLSATMTLVHELTHIWQYLNWDAGQIKDQYGSKLNLEIYEGMAKWVEIQYAYLLNEGGTAKREEIITRMRQDPYGQGFIKYAEVYPLSTGTRLQGGTPFDNPAKPL